MPPIQFLNTQIPTMETQLKEVEEANSEAIENISYFPANNSTANVKNFEAWIEQEKEVSQYTIVFFREYFLHHHHNNV
jgi:hypothetical protein